MQQLFTEVEWILDVESLQRGEYSWLLWLSKKTKTTIVHWKRKAVALALEQYHEVAYFQESQESTILETFHLCQVQQTFAKGFKTLKAGTRR
ncbi:hypothetical protein AV530_009946 [Patagioenas fasciata monilis]|uniref:Uncharacterized protein n=1 Tax=Patagioenas fasciata monilis TaxID=372326 RepID=A0A1V4KAV5_PATFA|nr:hypothetical protein AV530_009946 [Patagioenas fasciata monilis]